MVAAVAWQSTCQCTAVHAMLLVRGGLVHTSQHGRLGLQVDEDTKKRKEDLALEFLAKRITILECDDFFEGMSAQVWRPYFAIALWASCWSMASLCSRCLLSENLWQASASHPICTISQHTQCSERSSWCAGRSDLR